MARPDAGIRPNGTARGSRRDEPTSAFWKWTAGGPPPARAAAPVCGSPSCPRAAAGGTPSADSSGCARLRSHGVGAVAWPPRAACPVLLLPAVVGRLGHLNGAADIGDGLALSDPLLSDFELANDLLGCVADAFHGEVPGPVWPDEDSHSPWTDFRELIHPAVAAKSAGEFPKPMRETRNDGVGHRDSYDKAFETRVSAEVEWRTNTGKPDNNDPKGDSALNALTPSPANHNARVHNNCQKPRSTFTNNKSTPTTTAQISISLLTQINLLKEKPSSP